MKPSIHPSVRSSPDEVGAVAAEGGLLEEARDEFVVLHFMHVLLAKGSLAREAPHGLAGSVLPVAVGRRRVCHSPAICATIFLSTLINQRKLVEKAFLASEKWLLVRSSERRSLKPIS